MRGAASASVFQFWGITFEVIYLVARNRVSSRNKRGDFVARLVRCLFVGMHHHLNTGLAGR